MAILTAGGLAKMTRLFWKTMNKTVQKTDWFQTPLKYIQDYLLQDIEILHPLFNYAHGSTKWTRTYIHVWRWEKRTLFFVSYVSSDQRFIPCFLEMHLRGVSVSIENMYQTLQYYQNIALQCERINGRTLSSLGTKGNPLFIHFLQLEFHNAPDLFSIW